MYMIVVNGQSRTCAPGRTLCELLAETGYAQRRVAVEVNREIVPKSQHALREILDGDRIEIVHALGGG
ncbi:MAG: sulfur carrier protein ThiS [Xanthomonadaceae bacterium]|nr:sulfur carrier protein ThiS [Xanthomonadaceae bacterium]MDE1961633.1 sulfur carrier protein ThiS [Xanthomonadaceae bacterium]MDE2084767.1 sulfur carrier protein ThiS [Xanthomonadaceae bacterium]